MGSFILHQPLFFSARSVSILHLGLLCSICTTNLSHFRIHDFRKKNLRSQKFLLFFEMTAKCCDPLFLQKL
jgi:hypothetical protein